MYEDKTPESIKAEILAGISGMDTREGSYLDILISPVAYEIWKYYTALGAVEPILFITETSGEYIDRRCAEYGISRKPGTKATALMNFTGDDGVVVPAQKVFMTKEGLTFLLKEAVTIMDGTGKGTIEAEEVGTQYNVAAGTITVQSTALPGLSGWSNEASVGGTNEETDSELVQRFYDRLQHPATSGNAEHYKAWALETAGVGNCRVLPLWNGAGTVKLVITDSEGNPASSGIVSACASHIEEMRPIGAEVTVVAASSVEIQVSATLTLDGTAMLSDVQSKFTSALEDYLKSITFEKNEVLYSRIAFLLLDIGGVRDYANLTINNGTANITLDSTEVPVKGVISLVAA